MITKIAIVMSNNADTSRVTGARLGRLNARSITNSTLATSAKSTDWAEATDPKPASSSPSATPGTPASRARNGLPNK